MNNEMPAAGRHGSGKTSMVLYKLEVRTSSHSPTVIQHQDGEFVIDAVWREIHIRRGPTMFGMNAPVPRFESPALDYGLAPLRSVEALRWAFLAWLEANHVTGSICVETRLVAVKFTMTHETEEVGVGRFLGDMRNEPNFTPRVLPARETKHD